MHFLHINIKKMKVDRLIDRFLISVMGLDAAHLG